MAKIKTSELTGATLDWAVAECEGCNRWPNNPLCRPLSYSFRPSTDWSQGGPIIEQEKINVFSTSNGNLWCAQSDVRVFNGYGPTPLIAAMRCYVTSELGDEVEIPEELTS